MKHGPIVMRAYDDRHTVGLDCMLRYRAELCLDLTKGWGFTPGVINEGLRVSMEECDRWLAFSR